MREMAKRKWKFLLYRFCKQLRRRVIYTSKSLGSLPVAGEMMYMETYGILILKALSSMTGKGPT